MKESIPLQEGLFSWPDANPVLLGSQCTRCEEYFFPVRAECGQCATSELQEVALGNRGTLWTWTIQEFMPKSPYDRGETPESFRPYGVGYIELECGLRVETRLVESNPDQLAIGMKMELVIEAFRTEADGTERVHFAFAAVGGHSCG